MKMADFDPIFSSTPNDVKTPGGRRDFFAKKHHTNQSKNIILPCLQLFREGIFFWTKNLIRQTLTSSLIPKKNRDLIIPDKLPKTRYCTQNRNWFAPGFSNLLSGSPFRSSNTWSIRNLYHNSKKISNNGLHLFGKFDHHRLIDTLRIFPSPPSSKGNNKDESIESGLGVEEGGLRFAEALLSTHHWLAPTRWEPFLRLPSNMYLSSPEF